MTEVVERALALLDEHLNPDHDPSLAVRSVYGERFSYCYHVAPEWAARNIARIFPLPAAEQELWRAAWSGYLFQSHVDPAMCQALARDYDRAIVSAREAPPEHGLRDLDGTVADHMMRFYAAGALPLEGRAGLRRRFYEVASPRLWARGMECLGRALKQAGVIDTETAARLRTLCEWRVAVASEPGALPETVSEVRAFTWWFIAGRLGDVWEMEQLSAVLSTAGGVDRPHMVLQRLADLAAAWPGEAVSLLERVAEAQHRDRGFMVDPEPARRILLAARQAPDEQTREASRRVMSRLVAWGVAKPNQLGAD